MGESTVTLQCTVEQSRQLVWPLNTHWDQFFPNCLVSFGPTGLQFSVSLDPQCLIGTWTWSLVTLSILAVSGQGVLILT